MKRIFTLLTLVAVFASFTANAQITKASVWAPTSDNTNYFIYGGNYKNTVQAGVTITQLHKGWPDATKPTPAIGDYKFPHWKLLWHFNDLKDNKNNLDPADDVATTYFKVASIADGNDIYWTAHASDPEVTLAKTVAASHLPTRNGIFFAGVDADGGKHAQGVIKDKDWLRLQSYQGGGNALLVESVNDFLDFLSCGKTIKERVRSGTDPDYTFSANTLMENFLVTDSASVFAVKTADGDNALAFYPGKFDKTDLRLALQFDSSYVSSDITLKLLQVSKGTSGKNMTYKMVVSLMPPISGSAYNFLNIGSAPFVANTGCDKVDSLSYGETGPNRYVIENIFAAQGDAANMTATTTINVAELIKTKNPDFTINDFSKKRIIIAIIGEASETAPNGTHHPIIALDDIQVSYWIDWYKATNSGLEVNGGNPPTAIRDITASTTKVIGQKGQIIISGAKAAVTVYNLTGQKVGTLFNKGNQSIAVPAGIYLVAEPNQPTVKVVVR
ncbi:MAG: T9SS type A sorting domain-containing protein [Dysgonamonadaceae bacterium]|nr:T9SS type A sorting domain-containing protein [Dysgonamonadaceae bacterium]